MTVEHVVVVEEVHEEESHDEHENEEGEENVGAALHVPGDADDHFTESHDDEERTALGQVVETRRLLRQAPILSECEPSECECGERHSLTCLPRQESRDEHADRLHAEDEHRAIHDALVAFFEIRVSEPLDPPMLEQIDEHEGPHKIPGEHGAPPAVADASRHEEQQEHVDEQARLVECSAVAVSVLQGHREEPRLKDGEHVDRVKGVSLTSEETALRMMKHARDDADAVHEDEVAEQVRCWRRPSLERRAS